MHDKMTKQLLWITYIAVHVYTCAVR